MQNLKHSGVLAWLHLARAFSKLQRREADHLRPFGLTVSQFDVVAQLSAAPGMLQTELSERLLVTKGNVCGLVDRLTVAGLVERRTDEQDRRANHLFLTAAGAALAAEVVPAHERFLQDQMAVLTADEQRDLRRLLRKLDRALDGEPR